MPRSLFVMFDLDGTLVDTSTLYLTGVPLVARRHLGEAVDVNDYRDLWGHDVREWFVRAASLPRRSSEGAELNLVDLMYADFEAFYIANHHACPAYPHVAEGLACLKDLGHTVGIVTTRRNGGPSWYANCPGRTPSTSSSEVTASHAASPSPTH
jgi:phosphoglycolate phosphatase-like HAD superfamily hydrolase